MPLNTFIKKLPKAELHVHLIGTLEPEMLMSIAKRNNISAYKSLADAQQAYTQFATLDTFVKVYEQAMRVLQKEEDFYDLTLAYLEKASQQGVLRSEFIFEVQNFEPLGVSFATIINGIMNAVSAAKKKYDINAAPILCFLRDMDEQSALHALKQAEQYKDAIIACGLASTERNNPPEKFKTVFAKAREQGYKACIHAGEDMGADYIWQAIRDLHADRIDHGVRCIDDPELMLYLAETQLPLTICPISNALLNVFSAQQHPLKKLLLKHLNVSIHSDDPAFFKGYIDTNYAYAHHNIGLTRDQLITCAHNSIISSFADEEEKDTMLYNLKRFLAKQ
jgi:adenosine deaminase